MPPQDIPRLHKNYFELKVVEEKQIQEKFSALPLKVGHNFVKVFPLLFTRKDRSQSSETTLDPYQPRDATKGICITRLANILPHLS